MITRNYYNEIKDIKELPNVGKVLDLGCGEGRFSQPFYDAGFECSLVDIKGESLEKAQLNMPNALCIKDDLNKFLVMNHSEYDVVIANNILAFLGKNNFKEAMKKIYKILRPNGIFIGVFFGDRDPWVKLDKGWIFHSREEAMIDLESFKILDMREIDAKLGLMNGESKQWHRFEFIVKK